MHGAVAVADDPGDNFQDCADRDEDCCHPLEDVDPVGFVSFGSGHRRAPCLIAGRNHANQVSGLHGELRKARAAGKAVLLVSAELREVLSLADRIAVMYGGKIVTVLNRADASEEVLGPFMTGARREVAA